MVDTQNISWRVHERFPGDAAFSRQWNELAQNKEIPGIFATFEWIHTWWRHFGATRKLFLLCATIEDRLVALAPMMISTKRLFPLKPIRVMEFIGTAGVAQRGMGLADRIDFLYADGDETLYAELIKRLFSYRDSFDVLWLRALADGPTKHSPLFQYAINSGRLCRKAARSVSPYTETRGSWETFLAARPNKTRRQYKNSLRRLQEGGRHEIRTYPQNGWSFERAMQTILLIAHKSYKWRRGTSLLQSRDLARFLYDVYSVIDLQKWLRVHFLFIQGRPIAYQAGFCFAGRLYGYDAAYAENKSRAHPGVHLVLFAIKSAFEEGLLEYDMMRGHEAYKARWQSGRRYEVDIAIWRKSIGVRLYVFLFMRAKEWIKRIKWAQATVNRLQQILMNRPRPFG